MENKSIRILLAGDFHSIDPAQVTLSKKLKDLINSCDLNVINFEGALPQGKLTIPNKNILKQSFSSPEWCENNGFNVITLANNHSYDYGPEGLITTISAFKNSLIVGAGNWKEAYEAKYITIKNKTIAFLSGAAADLATLKDKWTDSNKIGCAWVNSPEFNKSVVEAKNRCDLLIVLPHGGLEYMNLPLPEWRDRYKELIDLGADAVIASHPHVPQGIEKYKGKPIFYSLGNFCFHKSKNKINTPFWNNGLLAILELNGAQLKYSYVSTENKNGILEIDETNEMQELIEKISEILKDNNTYMDQVNKDVLNFYHAYKDSLLAGFNAREVDKSFRSIIRIGKAMFFSKPNLKSALHQLREESTRWTITRALKIMSKTDL